MKRFITMMLFALVVITTNAQQADMARGADVSWCTEMEADGRKFYNANGTETEIMALMKEIGMTAIRLRVWVNPQRFGYGAWCDKADVVAKAKRARAAGLDLMIDFHYSDRFADPGQQYKPTDWTGYSLEQLKSAVANHTTDVLSALKTEGIEPLWVQVGNETRSGMIFDDGKIDWNKSGAAIWNGYIALSNAGYDAVKSVLPDAKVIVHIDKGQEDNVWFFKAFKQYGGKFDMIGLSHYPDWTNWSSDNTKTANNIKTLYSQFKVPVMIVETGYSSWDESRAASVMTDLFNKTVGISACAGIFYWEPEVYGSWKPAWYNTVNWGAYGMGAFSNNGRPSAALDAFSGTTASITTTEYSCTTPTLWYNLKGHCVISPTKGIYMNDGRKVLVR